MGDPADPIDVAEYEAIIYRELRIREFQTPQLSLPLGGITVEERNLMVDAICRFHYKLGLKTNSFYRFLSIFDAFISRRAIAPNELLLYASASLFIASKIEDTEPATIANLIILCNSKITRIQLVNAEIKISNELGFEFTDSTPYFYMNIFLRYNEQDINTCMLTRYILEMIQTTPSTWRLTGSKMAAIAVFAAWKIMHRGVWTREIEIASGYKEAELVPYLPELREVLRDQNRAETSFVRKKYGSEMFKCVAEIPLARFDW